MMSENVVIGVVSLVGFLCISSWFHVAFRFLCMYVPGQGWLDPPDFLFLIFTGICVVGWLVESPSSLGNTDSA